MNIKIVIPEDNQIDVESLIASLQKWTDSHQLLCEISHYADDTEYFTFRHSTGTTTIQLPYEEILCFTSYNHTIDITTKKEVHSCRASLKSILPYLPSYYIQCHRSHIVNMHHIYKLESYHITLTNGMVIPISRNYWDNFRSAYATFSKKLF